MPPHCDTMDGPVVTAARKALEAQNVNLALAYVPENGGARDKIGIRESTAGPQRRPVRSRSGRSILL